jgi:hypothetical protein
MKTVRPGEQLFDVLRGAPADIPPGDFVIRFRSLTDNSIAAAVATITEQDPAVGDTTSNYTAAVAAPADEDVWQGEWVHDALPQPVPFDEQIRVSETAPPIELPESDLGDFVRLVRGTAAKVYAAFDPTPASVTVKVDRADGTEIVPSAAATNEGGGLYSVSLIGTHTATLDLLTVTFDATGPDEQRVVTAEVCGGRLFTLARARQKKPLNDTTKYTDAQLEQARIAAEDELEEACGYAFVPRYRRERVYHDGLATIRLEMRHVRQLRGVTVDDVALTADELEAVRFIGPRTLAHVPGFSRIADIAYEHGLDRPPGNGADTALLLARHFLVDSGVDARATSVTTDAGTLRLAGWVPEVEAFVRRHGRPDLSLR